MNREKLEKYFYAGLTASGVVIVGILFFFLIFQMNSIGKTLHMMLQLLQPFIYGAVIAYLLAPICNFFERRMRKLVKALIKEPELKDKEQEKLKREKQTKRVNSFSKVFAMIITFFLTFIFIFGLVALVIPQITTSMIKIKGMIESVPNILDDIYVRIQQLLQKYPTLETNILAAYNEMAQHIEKWLREDLLPNWGILAGNIFNGVIGVANVSKNLFIGVIAAVYLLMSKETLLAQAKKIIYSLFGANYGNKVIEEARYTHKVFGGFIVGKLIDSLIIGILCFIILWIVKIPYAVLVSVIVGVTNVIPFFGPYIGAIPSALLILLISPFKCLQFVVIIIILQQFDGNILGPKILGNSTGLTGFWVLFSIIVFGGWFGFIGMLIGVPLFAVIYNFIRRSTNFGLKKKGLSMVTDDYKNLKGIDEDSQYIK